MYPAVYTEEAGAMSIVENVLPLRKWELKVKRRAELEPNEYEYLYNLRQGNRSMDAQSK
jgi:hypothetical protein